MKIWQANYMAWNSIDSCEVSTFEADKGGRKKEKSVVTAVVRIALFEESVGYFDIDSYSMKNASLTIFVLRMTPPST